MRIAHTMIRVTDLQKSIDFYTQVLGMSLLSRKDYPTGRFTLAFVGYGDKTRCATIELTHNWDNNTYDIGNAFGHIAIATSDIYQLCDHARALHATISREPGPMKGGKTVIAFIDDPDGYKIELIQQP